MRRKDVRVSGLDVPEIDKHLRTVQQIEIDEIYNRLVMFKGNKTKAAKSIGLSVRTIRSRCSQYKDVHPIGQFHIATIKQNNDNKFLVRKPMYSDED